MWSGKEKLPPGSKEKPSECGLEGKIAARVKGKAIGVWSGRENRCKGQRGSHRSVVWEGKTAAWVKEEAIGVWSGKEKLPPGSKRKPSECGLARKKRRPGQRESRGSVVWQGKTAARVKETPPRKVINKKMKENERK